MDMRIQRSAVADARRALTEIKATTETGVEGLVAELLSAEFGISLRICSSGRQFGKDLGSGHIAAEVKRYDSAKLRVRELVGEIGIAKRRSPELLLWILVTTQRLSPDDLEELEAAASAARIELAVIDWSPARCPRSLVLMARHLTTAKSWFEENQPGIWGRISPAIGDVMSRGEEFSRVTSEIAALAAGLTLFGKFGRTLIESVRLALSDDTARKSIVAFDQRIDLAVSSSGAIERPELYAKLDKALASAREDGARTVVVVGAEGVGKTWAVVDYATRFWPDRPLLFLSSLLLEEGERSNWSNERTLREAAVRTISILDQYDDRFRSGELLDRLLENARRADLSPWSPVIIFDGFNERRGSKWSRLISALPELLGEHRSFDVFVTCRPMSWERLSRSFMDRGVRFTEFTVGGFSETEFAAACAKRNIGADAFDPHTAKDLRNPRLFRIAGDLLHELAGAPVTRERVFMEYWRHRQIEGTGRHLEPRDFTEFLSEQAREVWKNIELLQGRRTQYFDVETSQSMARFSGVESALRDIQDVVSTNFFRSGNRDDSREMRFAPDRRNYILGLSFQREVTRATDGALNVEDNRAAAMEELERRIGPISETDAAGVITATALLASCLQKTRNEAVSLSLLRYLLRHRNARNYEVAPTVRGMILVAACAYPAVFIAAADELDERDPWLVEALRTALSVSVERDVVSSAVQRWLSKESEAAESALHILAGHELTPYKKKLYARLDPDGECGLVFWLMFLDRASRTPILIEDLYEQTVDDIEESDATLEDEGEGYLDEIERMICADIARVTDTGIGEDAQAHHRADGLWADWSDDYDPGHVPILAPSFGADWHEIDRWLPAVLAKRWDQNRPEMFLFHLQLLENRLAQLSGEARAGLLRAVIIRCPPPPSPSNYQVHHPSVISDNEIDAIVVDARSDDESLLTALRWLNYFSYTAAGLSRATKKTLIDVLVDQNRGGELRSEMALFLRSGGDESVAQLIEKKRIAPDTEPDATMCLHCAIVLAPLCRASGGYLEIRERLVPTMLPDVVEQVHCDDLGAVLADFDTHVERCIGEIENAEYPKNRTIAGCEIMRAERGVPLASLEMTVAASRRIAEADVQKAMNWFSQLMNRRGLFTADHSVMEFLFDLLVGIGERDSGEAADGLQRVIDHLADIASEADDAVLIPDRLVYAAFALPCDHRTQRPVAQMIMAANQDATLSEIAHSARGAWRNWLEKFCTLECASRTPSRVALGRTLQALAGFAVVEASAAYAPTRVEENAREIHQLRLTAETALTDWCSSSLAQRRILETTIFEAAVGQVIDLPDLARLSGDEGRLFLARIEAHRKLQVDGLRNSLYGLSGPPTRIVASNLTSRVVSAIANRPRIYGERRD